LMSDGQHRLGSAITSMTQWRHHASVASTNSAVLSLA
jgi:hypothetical protein